MKKIIVRKVNVLSEKACIIREIYERQIIKLNVYTFVPIPKHWEALIANLTNYKDHLGKPLCGYGHNALGVNAIL